MELLEVDYILLQCNCISVKGDELYNKLAKKFIHLQLYQRRRALSGRNLAIEKDRSVPGTAIILWGQGKPNIICLFSQWRPGSVKTPHCPESDPPETEAQRLIWFISGLNHIGEHFTKLGKRVTIAIQGSPFPEEYKKALEEFREKYSSVITLISVE